MPAAEAMEVVQRTIEQQVGEDNVPNDVHVTVQKLTVSSDATEILYFDDLWKTDLHARRYYYVVRIFDSKHHVYHIYVAHQRDAELFIDALYVLLDENKHLATLADAERAQRIRRVERQRKQLEIEIDVSAGSE